jgi:hypothetical protein
MATRRMVLSSLPSREYHGPDYKLGVPHIYALRRRFFADIIELHVFRSTEVIVPPPSYEMVARVERRRRQLAQVGPRGGGTSCRQEEAWGGHTFWALTHQL